MRENFIEFFLNSYDLSPVVTVYTTIHRLLTFARLQLLLLLLLRLFSDDVAASERRGWSTATLGSSPATPLAMHQCSNAIPDQLWLASLLTRRRTCVKTAQTAAVWRLRCLDRPNYICRRRCPTMSSNSSRTDAVEPRCNAEIDSTALTACGGRYDCVMLCVLYPSCV